MAQHNEITPIRRSLIALLASLIAIATPAFTQSPPPAKPVERTTPPTRDPHTPGYVAAKELPGRLRPSGERGR